MKGVLLDFLFFKFHYVGLKLWNSHGDGEHSRMIYTPTWQLLANLVWITFINHCAIQKLLHWQLHWTEYPWSSSVPAKVLAYWWPFPSWHSVTLPVLWIRHRSPTPPSFVDMFTLPYTSEGSAAVTGWRTRSSETWLFCHLHMYIWRHYLDRGPPSLLNAAEYVWNCPRVYRAGGQQISFGHGFLNITSTWVPQYNLSINQIFRILFEIRYWGDHALIST